MPGVLGALAREQEGDRTRPPGVPTPAPAGIAARGESRRPPRRLAGDDDPPVLGAPRGRPGACRRRRRDRSPGRSRAEMVAPGGPSPLSSAAACAPRAAAAARAGPTAPAAARGRLLEHHVGVGAADAERADAGAARRCPRRGQGAQLGVDVERARARSRSAGSGVSKCRLGGISPVLQREHRLDQAGDAGGGVEVADVGLDRAEGAEAPVGAVRRGTPGSAPRPRSDRRAACRCRGPRRS